MEYDEKIECPLCGWHIIMEGACGMESDNWIECRGVYGMHCLRCHEIFDVPIGPEDRPIRETFTGHDGFPAELFPERRGTPPSPIIGEVDIDCLACGAQPVGLREDGLCKCECGELFGAMHKPLEDK
jgi:hypothetical protein